MQWFIANMWMALAASAVFGLFFGFSFRGLLAGSRVRRAEVEREIAKTELNQSKSEVEALYAAQRKRKEETAQAVGVDADLQAELDERESRITSLGAELTAAREELDQLKQSDAAQSATATEPEGTETNSTPSGELTQLQERNTWLEERVSALEADLSAQPVVSPEASSAADQSHQKLQWQSAYLRQRVDALEAKIIQTPSAETPVPSPEPVPESAPILTPVAAAEPAPAETSEADEELARLRWRNRYLEGRLAYFEQEPDAAEADSASETTSEVEVAPADIEATEPASEPEAAAEPESTPVAEPVETPEVRASEAMLAELEGAQPEQIDRPSNGGDDLTAITGVGPRIAEVLNGLGIWTYQQIATWLPEHETWIENHLSFKGRVSRENWVGQAKDLIAAE